MTQRSRLVRKIKPFSLSSKLPSGPVISGLLQQRQTCICLTGVAAVHLGMVSLGLPGWQCPMRYGLGVPCPGCGLSRALQALAIGNWQQAIALHAFAPLVALMLGVIGLAAVLPNPGRLRLINHIERWEQRTKLVWLMGGGFLIYWFIRLIFFNQQLYRLVMTG